MECGGLTPLCIFLLFCGAASRLQSMFRKNSPPKEL
jgi:hypothetical protein